MRNKMFSKALIVLLAVILSFSTMLLLAYAATNVGISVTNLSAAYENGTVQSHNGSASWSGSGTSLSGSVTGQDAGSSGSGWCATSWSAGASDSTLTFTSSSTYPATLSFNYSLGLNDGTVIIDGVNKTQDGSFSKSLTNGQTVAVKITSATAEKTTSINITNISMTVNPVSLTAATANSTMGTASVDPMSVTPPGTATWTATSITGYRFVRWTNSSGEGVSAETSYTVEGITEATTFTANFEAIPLTTVTFAPAVSVSGDEDGGSYTVSGSTISGIQTLAYNSSSISVADYITSSVVLVATPKSSVYAFDGWYDATGGQLSTSATWTPTLEEIEGKTIHAQFSSNYVSVPFGPVSNLFPNGTYTVTVGGTTTGGTTVTYQGVSMMIGGTTTGGTTTTMDLDSELYRVEGNRTDMVTVEAVPDADYEVLGWLNTALEPVYFASKFTAPLAFFEQAGEMFPYFQYAKARITVQDTDKATVAVTVGGVNQTVGEEISADPDAVVTLSLTNIDSAYTFDGWVDGNGVIQSTNTTWTTDMTVLTGYTETTHEQSGITVTERSQTNYSIAPSFTWTKATLTLIPGNNGSMTAGVTGSTPTAISAQTTVTELKTASYTLTALESDSNYVFVGWYDGSGNLISSNMTLTDAFSNLVDYGSITPRFQSAMVTMKVTASANGTTTFDGAAVSGTQTKTLDSRQIYTLAATPADGYVFNGWLDQNNNCLSSSATWSTAPVMGENGAVITVHASFIATSGLAVWQVTDTNGATYTDLSDAVATGAKKIILHTDGTLPAGDYTIPSGVTLLIPYNSDYTSYTSANFVSATTGASAFRTLTMSSGSNLFVNGTLELGGQLSDNGQFNGSCGKPVGPDGRINMASGSKITVNNGGKLYAWGYIYGNGEVIAKSGASIDEAFQMKNYRGGTITSQIYNKVFPFNQYYVQNIEVPLTFEAGAREYVSSAVNVTLAGQQKCNFMFIGGSSDTCLFKLQSGATLRKDYIESTDRLEFKLNGNASMDAVSITIKVTVNTNNYPLPLTSNMSVDIESGTTTINQAISLLPGAEIYVREGATVSIASGKGVYVYDRDEWINNNEQSYVAQDGTKHLYQVAYTASKNEAPGIRNESSLVDAKLQIDGVLNVGVSSSSKGYLYTSASGGNITSSGTGRINFVVAPTAGSLPECNMSGSVVSVNFSAPKLHNGDDSYTTTAGSSAGTTYYYCATHDKWETSHDITYHSNLTVDNTATQSIVGGSSSLKDFAGLSVDWAKTGYSFASWNTAANGSGDTYAVGDSVNFNSEAVPADLYAQWEANTYTLTLNPNGGTVDPNSGSITYDATYGDAFNENGAETGTLPTPVRTSGSTSYRFDGWFTQATGGTRVESTDTVQVTADTTLFAHWSVMYNVSFVSNGGSAVEPQQVAYNGFVTKPEAPTKSGNTFDGWYSDAELTNEFDFGTRITSSTELYAKWTAHNAIVTITYDLGLNASNPSTTLTYHYGDTLDAPTYIYYDFSSWSYSDKSDLSTTDMKSELDTLLLNSTNQAVSVTAVFTRQQYEIQLWGNANGSAAAISGWSRNKAVGKSIRVSAPSTYGNPAHSFSYWEIQKDLNGNGEFTNVKTIDTISTQKATICITEPGTYRAIAYFGVAEQGSKINLRIVNRFAEKYGDSKRVGVTMEISMPETGYTIQEIGFLSSPDTKYYTSSTYRNESGYNPEVIPGAHSENADLLRIKNGSYTRRFTTFDNDPSTTDYDNYYVVGYLIYKIDGSDDCHYLYCTYSVGKTDTIAANTMDFFDTLNYDALLSPAP